jgi:hypothetical protein
VYVELRRRGLAIDDRNRDEFLLAGVFGTVHPEWNPIPFLDQLARTAGELRRQPVLLAVGRIGSAGPRALARTVGRYGTDLPCVNLGEQSPERISEFFQALDFGIATSPWALIGKSGTAAAMLDHGLPVAVPRDDWKLRAAPTPEPAPHPLLFRGGETFFTALRRGFPASVPKPRLAELAERMIEDLRAATGARRPNGAGRWIDPAVNHSIT